MAHTIASAKTQISALQLSLNSASALLEPLHILPRTVPRAVGITTKVFPLPRCRQTGRQEGTGRQGEIGWQQVTEKV